MWTSDAGTHHIGVTAYAEALVAASAEGRTLVFTANAEGETTDLMIAPSDLSAPKVLIASMGRGSETTCGAHIGFVGERLFVGWCAAGSRTGRIERFENTDGEWRSTLIAATGSRIFYVRSGVDRDAGQEREGLFSQAIP